MILYAPGHSPDLPTFYFYNGTEKLTFTEADWKYHWHRPDGIVELDGVTGITGITTPVQPIKTWAVKLALAKTKELLLAGGYLENQLTEDQLDAILAQAKKADTEALEDAGDLGTAAHNWLEKLIRATIYSNEEKRLELFANLPLDERSANAAIAGVVWMYRHKVRWVHTEVKIFSRKYKYAGTCDGVAYVSSCDDPNCCPTPFAEVLSCIDWKSSNHLRVGYLFQVAAYRAALIEERNLPIVDSWILRLPKTAEGKPFDPWRRVGVEAFEEDFKGFLNCLETNRSMDASERWVSGINAGRTAEKRAAAKEEKMLTQKIKCSGSDKYKGVRLPVCNGGDPCLACVRKYDERHPKEPLTPPAEPCTIRTVQEEVVL
jgi:hypothetical protein